MKKIENNFAFIDGQNLNLGILELGWKLDFSRFRQYLKEKYAKKTGILFHRLCFRKSGSLFSITESRLYFGF